MSYGPLFSKSSWFQVLDQSKRRLVAEVDKIAQDRLLNMSTADLTDYFVEKYSMDVPRLDRDGIEATDREVDIDVRRDYERMIVNRNRPVLIKGTEIQLRVPFSGDEGLFHVRPSRYSSMLPIARVSPSTVTVVCQGVRLTRRNVRHSLDQTIENIEQHLGWLREDAEAWRDELRRLANRHVLNRRAKLIADRQLVESLGYPIKKRNASAETFRPPEVRRRIPPSLPQSSATPFQPEPALDNKYYDFILETIQNMSVMMERSPTTFHAMDEQAIRTLILVHLNGHYRGEATGETFNFDGKTDILIRSDDRNIFIAECKFWHGPKKLSQAIDQILRYVAWRDTKTAILIFSRNSNFSRVLDKIPNVVQEHPCYKRDCEYGPETGFRFVLRRPDDPAREVTLTVLAFDLPI